MPYLVFERVHSSILTKGHFLTFGHLRPFLQGFQVVRRVTEGCAYARIPTDTANMHYMQVTKSNDRCITKAALQYVHYKHG